MPFQMAFKGVLDASSLAKHESPYDHSPFENSISLEFMNRYYHT